MIATLAGFLLGSTALAVPEGVALLHPTQYASPSGAYVLDVDPSHRLGAGPGRYVMTREGEELWSKELPVTMWRAAVTDSGYAGGFAYSIGYHSYDLGSFHVLVLSPTGEVVLDEETPRTLSTLLHTAPDPRGIDVLVSDHLDRLVVRIANPDGALEEVWKAYRLSTGEAIEVIGPSPPVLSTPIDRVYLDEVRAIPDTPLTLMRWWYVGYGSRRGSSPPPSGTVFVLQDPKGRCVWSLERRADYTVPGDAKAQLRLESRVREHGAILGVAPEGRFILWDVGAKERVEFQVTEPQRDGTWLVERGKSEAYVPSSMEPPEPLPEIEPELLGTVSLTPAPAASDVFTAPAAALVDPLGRILIRDDESGVIQVFDASGASLFVCRPEPGDLEDDDSAACMAVDCEGTVHLASTMYYGDSPRFLRFDGEGRRTGLVDLGTARVAFDPNRPVAWIDRTLRDGTLQQVTAEGKTLAVVSRRSDQHWLRDLSGFDVAPDGALALIDSQWLFDGDPGEALALYDRDGAPRATIPLPRGFFGRHLAASNRWLVVGGYGSKRLLVRVEDGETFEFDGCPGEGSESLWAFGFSPDGRELWGVDVTALKLHRFALPE